jgi:hypothetical protein
MCLCVIEPNITVVADLDVTFPTARQEDSVSGTRRGLQTVDVHHAPFTAHHTQRRELRPTSFTFGLSRVKGEARSTITGRLVIKLFAVVCQQTNIGQMDVCS